MRDTYTNGGLNNARAKWRGLPSHQMRVRVSRVHVSACEWARTVEEEPRELRGNHVVPQLLHQLCDGLRGHDGQLHVNCLLCLRLHRGDHTERPVGREPMGDGVVCMHGITTLDGPGHLKHSPDNPKPHARQGAPNRVREHTIAVLTSSSQRLQRLQTPHRVSTMRWGVMGSRASTRNAAAKNDTGHTPNKTTPVGAPSARHTHVRWVAVPSAGHADA